MRDLIALASPVLGVSLSVFPSQEGTRRCQGDLAGGEVAMTVELEAGPNDLELLLRDSARGIDRFCSVFRTATTAAPTAECGLLDLGEVQTQAARVSLKKTLVLTWKDAGKTAQTRTVTLKPLESGEFEVALLIDAQKPLVGKLSCRTL